MSGQGGEEERDRTPGTGFAACRMLSKGRVRISRSFRPRIMRACVGSANPWSVVPVGSFGWRGRRKEQQHRGPHAAELWPINKLCNGSSAAMDDGQPKRRESETDAARNND